MTGSCRPLSLFVLREQAVLRAMSFRSKKDDSFEDSDEERKSGERTPSAPSLEAEKEEENLEDIPYLDPKAASRILRGGKDKSWILRRNEEGEMRISVKSENSFKQIRLYGDESKTLFSRRTGGQKVWLGTLLASLVEDGTLGERMWQS